LAKEKRKHKRLSRRLKSRYGENELDHSAITGDVSASGAFIQSAHLPKLGTRLHMEFTSRDGFRAFVETVVARHVVVPVELRSIVKSGFGVRFVTFPELLPELLPELKSSSTVVVSYDTPLAFRAAWDAELHRGGVFLWSQTSPALNSLLTLQLELPYCSKRLTFDVRVVNIVTGPTGQQGTTLIFVDAAGAIAALRDMLAT
jgi:hypothetical protein